MILMKMIIIIEYEDIHTKDTKEYGRYIDYPFSTVIYCSTMIIIIMKRGMK